MPLPLASVTNKRHWTIKRRRLMVHRRVQRFAANRQGAHQDFASPQTQGTERIETPRPAHGLQQQTQKATRENKQILLRVTDFTERKCDTTVLKCSSGQGRGTKMEACLGTAAPRRSSGGCAPANGGWADGRLGQKSDTQSANQRGRFRTARAQCAHSASYYGDHPGNNPENHLRNHAQSIQSSKIQTSDACHGSRGPKFCLL